MPEAAVERKETWTIRRALAWTAQHFDQKRIDAPRLTAEILLAHVLGQDRVRLYVDLDRPLSPGELSGFRGLIARRLTGEPTQYLTGVRDFYNRAFQVDRRVLIPRPETELLVEAVLRVVPEGEAVRLLDLCTGSGCIGVTLACERPQAQVVATDVSPEACAVAHANAERLGTGARVEVRQGDLFAPLAPGESFSAIATNPPYIATAELPGLPAEVRSEPGLALDGGADGLAFYRRIAQGAPAWLAAGGLLALEIGETQGAAVRQLLVDAGFLDVRIERDLERRDRLAFGRWRG